MEIKDKNIINELNKKQKRNMILKNKLKFLNYKVKLNKFKKMNKHYKDQN